MTEDEFIHDFSQEVDCTYKEERYSVRDNGAVLKHPRVGKRIRPTDNQWTLGKLNENTGYLEIASVRVHRIVATAFHGEPPTKEHVVDHIDTNKQNNRPENLRWVTRFENALLNPITAKRIALVCGSVEAFLANPSKFRHKLQDQNHSWMTKVSTHEAQISLERLLNWAKSDKKPSGGSLGKWIFDRSNLQNSAVDPVPDAPEIIDSKTLNAAQRNWKVPSEFPCCPQERVKEPLIAYAKELKAGSVFCQNDAYTSLVYKRATSDDGESIYVIAESTEGENAVKPWALSMITFENGLYVHTSLGSFFTKEGADKQYHLDQGLEWTGGDTFDDYI